MISVYHLKKFSIINYHVKFEEKKSQSFSSPCELMKLHQIIFAIGTVCLLTMSYRAKNLIPRNNSKHRSNNNVIQCSYLKRRFLDAGFTVFCTTIKLLMWNGTDGARSIYLFFKLRTCESQGEKELTYRYEHY